MDPKSLALAAALVITAHLTSLAQPAPAGPQVISPEVAAGRQVKFRILAPQAQAVRLVAGDIPGTGQSVALTRGTNGVWEATLGPIDPGTYRYYFSVDGVSVIDPRNPSSSESNAHLWSLVHVPQSDFMDLKEVPHGAVAEVTYYSKSLQRFRRMHVYTPPGYENGEGRFPVFYLLHGASDSDDSWSSVGRAGVILDNLIAAKKAKPMIVVMPAGHTSRLARIPGAPRPATDEFTKDFVEDIMPCVEGRYRVRAERQFRALAGLSMGGGQTLTIGMANLNQFAYLGVFSSGVFGIVPRAGATNRPSGPSFEERNQAVLADPALKEGLKLLWFATGKDDFLVETSRATVALLKKHNFDVIYQETEGAHTWIVWREYLIEFAQQLF